MPALSGDRARVVLRPRVGRWVPEVLAVVVVLGDLAMVVALPWSLPNRIGVLAIGVFVGLVLHRLAAVRIVADEHGLLVVNPRQRRQLDYAEVVSVSLEPAAPWVVLDLDDGTTLSAMAIQGSEGARAQHQVALLRDLLSGDPRRG